MATAIIGQVAVVPILLSRWSSSTYGVWLAIHALVGLLSIVNSGYQTYLLSEFLKLGRGRRKDSISLVWSSLPVAWVVSLLELVALCLICIVFGFGYLLPENPEPLGAGPSDISLILLAYASMNLLLMPFGGIATRLLTVYGYFSRLTAWAILRQLAALIVPVVFLLNGSDFLWVGLSWVAAHSLCGLFSTFDLFYLMRKEQLLGYSKPNRREGWSMLLKSQLITLRESLDTMRNRGMRILLAGAVGTSAVAVFSANRTVSNILQQGVSTITHPLLPDLMDAVVRRDQKDTEIMFAVVWSVLIFVMIPSMIVMQITIQPLFEWWTQGKIQFDPVLFSLFALGILVFALSQPSLSILIGNNLLRAQLVLSISAGLAALISTMLLLPVFGLIGVGIALLLGELTAVCCCVYSCKKWMREQGLHWPTQSFAFVVISILTASVASFLSASLSIAWALLGAIICISLTFFWGFCYLRTTPLDISDILKCAYWKKTKNSLG